MRQLIFINFIVSIGLFAGGDLSAAPNGAGLYHEKCAVCHGEAGSGGVGVPLDLPDFLAVADDKYFHSTIQNGRPGRVMPAFPRLSKAEIDAIIAYLRGFSTAEVPVYQGSTFHGDAKRGETLFKAHCVSCHGDKGQGGSGTGVTFSRPRGTPVVAPSLSNSGFQQAVSDEMLKSTLLRGRRGTPMPSIKSLGLNEKDADDLIAYIRTLNDVQSADTAMEKEPIIQFESSYNLEETLANLKGSIMGHNFRVIREQKLEYGLTEESKENPKAVMLYFCDFGFLNEALAVDPRVGLFLPCRVTVLDTGKGVKVMSINPKNLSHLFNNSELDKACEKMHDLYVGIMEEATI